MHTAHICDSSICIILFQAYIKYKTPHTIAVYSPIIPVLACLLGAIFRRKVTTWEGTEHQFRNVSDGWNSVTEIDEHDLHEAVEYSSTNLQRTFINIMC